MDPRTGSGFALGMVNSKAGVLNSVLTVGDVESGMNCGSFLGGIGGSGNRAGNLGEWITELSDESVDKLDNRDDDGGNEVNGDMDCVGGGSDDARGFGNRRSRLKDASVLEMLLCVAIYDETSVNSSLSSD